MPPVLSKKVMVVSVFSINNDWPFPLIIKRGSFEEFDMSTTVTAPSVVVIFIADRSLENPSSTAY
jgi:hypothetical protein